jgi:hypothetical protein
MMTDITVTSTVFEKRVTKVVVVPENAPIFDEQATSIEIDDDAAGEFIVISQAEGRSTRIEKDEWPFLRDAINEMMERVR